MAFIIREPRKAYSALQNRLIIRIFFINSAQIMMQSPLWRSEPLFNIHKKAISNRKQNALLS